MLLKERGYSDSCRSSIHELRTGHGRGKRVASYVSSVPDSASQARRRTEAHTCLLQISESRDEYSWQRSLSQYRQSRSRFVAAYARPVRSTMGSVA
eukprot:1031897-Rhodomonas_salina.1